MSGPALYPCITHSYIESCQFSSWYTSFSSVSPLATVIRPLCAEFRTYLEDDRVMVPEGSEDFPPLSSLSDGSASEDEDSEDLQPKRYAFLELDKQIRDVIVRYGAVFPKLNWTSPQDSSWVLPTLKCTSPADVYLLLKSSDFISHDVDPLLAFEGCIPHTAEGSPSSTIPNHELELVLKKWYSISRSREFRCFVRDEILFAISQRDPNYYPYLNEQPTRDKIIYSVSKFWMERVRTKFKGGGDYIFDLHLTRDLSSAHILDFNPYHPKTDPILFTYDELLQLLVSASSATSGHRDALSGQLFMPALRTVTSPSHPTASRNAPTNQHNAVPFEALQISAGNDLNTFSRHWQQELERNLNAEIE